MIIRPQTAFGVLPLEDGRHIVSIVTARQDGPPRARGSDIGIPVRYETSTSVGLPEWWP